MIINVHNDYDVHDVHDAHDDGDHDGGGHDDHDGDGNLNPVEHKQPELADNLGSLYFHKLN